MNDKQIEAVTAIEGPVLILAGAGSGKTKALTHRIAYLIASDIHPENILAVTFTNKAAGEIKHRVAGLVGGQMPTMGTFHSVCLRMLRQDIKRLEYDRNFVVYDAQDQEALMKQCMLEVGLDIKKISPKTMLGRVSELKSELAGPDEFEEKVVDVRDEFLAQAYHAYQQNLRKANALDFDDLIMLTVQLLRTKPEVLTKYQNLWRYIMIDEYQDTNHAQYVWVNLLAQKYRNLAVVGDDAQSIYGWRKADIRNILDFEKDYPEAKVVLLEQNYRSTQTILTAANHLIANNKSQKQKKLWTDKADGAPIIVKEANDTLEEGAYVIANIKAGGTVLYRTHAQSRAMEEALVRQGIPYRILGGLRFYERREIKDILAYLRLIANPKDTVSFVRICNTPPRGLGPVALKNKTAPYQKFQDLMDELRAESERIPLASLLRFLLKKIDYELYLTADKSAESIERWENVKELLTATAGKKLEAFLEEVALLQETDKLETEDGAVNLMTLHSAKGLEFPTVFIIGLEDGVFPHSRSLFDPAQLEEERRLAYVGITRAREQLHLVFCRQRQLYGSTQLNPPSRFIFEIPESLVTFIPADEKEFGTTFSY